MTAPTFTTTAVAKTLRAAGFDFDPLTVWKQKRTGSIIVNLPIEAVAVLTAAGFNVTTAQRYFIVIERA